LVISVHGRRAGLSPTGRAVRGGLISGSTKGVESSIAMLGQQIGASIGGGVYLSDGARIANPEVLRG